MPMSSISIATRTIPEGSLYILKGSLAPGGAVVKASGVAKAMWRCTLQARVFEDEEGAIDALRAGSIIGGNVHHHS